MKEKSDHKILFFIYNANSGVLNAALDSLFKFFSSSSYACDLCAITHGSFGMRKEWEEFIQTLAIPVRYLHKDEWQEKYDYEVELPAILLFQAKKFEPLICGDEMRKMDMSQLQVMIKARLKIFSK